ncbi:hypothetical protein AAHA92_15612 [Salvia divinorum]|uniref:Uncharacterized protein n=1 Tax=Salvia divinorum TaxID=28513 RepID=A0ABD1HG50_SALDI
MEDGEKEVVNNLIDEFNTNVEQVEVGPHDDASAFEEAHVDALNDTHGGVEPESVGVSDVESSLEPISHPDASSDEPISQHDAIGDEHDGGPQPVGVSDVEPSLEPISQPDAIGDEHDGGPQPVGVSDVEPSLEPISQPDAIGDEHNGAPQPIGVSDVEASPTPQPDAIVDDGIVAKASQVPLESAQPQPDDDVVHSTTIPSTQNDVIVEESIVTSSHSGVDDAQATGEVHFEMRSEVEMGSGMASENDVYRPNLENLEQAEDPFVDNLADIEGHCMELFADVEARFCEHWARAGSDAHFEDNFAGQKPRHLKTWME